MVRGQIFFNVLDSFCHHNTYIAFQTNTFPVINLDLYMDFVTNNDFYNDVLN